MGNKYTFDNLVNMVVKAVRDRQLVRMELSKHSVSFVARLTRVDGLRFEHFVVGVDSTENAIAQYVKFIESLRIETFVIEDADSLLRINKNIKSLVLANGCDIADRIHFDDYGMYYKDGWDNSAILGVDILKGATVTQIKGDE